MKIFRKGMLGRLADCVMFRAAESVFPIHSVQFQETRINCTGEMPSSKHCFSGGSFF